jgi:hypothetical protein
MQRRKHGRVRAHGVMGHLVTGEKLSLALPVDNLSLGGAFLRTAKPLRPGTAIEIDLGRPGLPPIRLSARVVSAITPELAFHQRTIPGMGIAFAIDRPEDEERLRQLLSSLAPANSLLVGDDPRSDEGPVLDRYEAARLKVQVRGLLLEISEWQSRADSLVRENNWLKAEMLRLRRALFGEAGGTPPPG